MAKILRSGEMAPAASLGKFAAASGVLAAGSLMVAGWAAGAFSGAPGLIAGLLGSWPVGLFGVGAVAAAGLWLVEGKPAREAAVEPATNIGEVGNMANPVMVNPQVAFALARANR